MNSRYRFFTVRAAFVAIGSVFFAINVSAACVVPPSGLVGWWPGNGDASDIVGGNNGTFANPSFSPGQVVQAFNFDGSGNYVRIPASATLDVGTGNGLTIEAWINPADLAQRPIVEWAVNGDYAMHLWANALTPGALYASLFGTDGGAHVIQSVGGILHANTFQHVAVTYDKASGIARLFVNGATVAESSFGSFTPRTASDLYIGYRPAGSPAGPVSFRGQIDEVSIYNRALSTGELQAIYTAGSGGKCMPVASTSIVTNGGLELLLGDTFRTVLPGSSYAGWSSVGGGDIEFITIQTAVPGGFFGPMAKGSGCVDLNGIAYQGAISQMLTTEPGVVYQLRFAMSGNPGILGQPKRAAKTIDVSWGAINVGSFEFKHLPSDTQTNMRWEYHEVLVTGTGHDALRFTSTTGAYNDAGPVIDDISVVRILSPLLSIISQPADQAVSVGGTATFSVGATGTQPLSYQWRFNGTNLSGAIASSLVLTNVQLTNAGNYAVVVSNSVGTVTSSNAVLTVSAVPPATLLNVNFAAYDQVKTGFAATGQTGSDFWNSLTFPFQASAGLGGLKRADGAPTGAGVTVQDGGGHTAFSHPDPMYRTACYAQAGVITLTVTNLPSGEYELYLYGHAGASTANTVFHLLVGGADFGNKSTATDASWSLTNWVEGAQYVVYRGVTVTNGGAPVIVKCQPGVSGYSYLNGVQIKAAGSSAPVIVSQPASQSVLVGADVTFSVTAGGIMPLSYQWLFNGTNLSGATGSVLVRTNVQLRDAGNYAVVVSNNVGTVTSSNATLTVNVSSACATSPSGLVGWWRGEANALDQAGTNNGTLAGNTTYGAGRVGQAFVFDGSGDGVSVGNPAELHMQTFTIEAWVKRSNVSRVSLDPGGDAAIFDSSWGGYGFAIFDDGRLALTKIGYSYVASSIAITDTNNFHHVAVTKTGTNVVFYLDGASQTAAPFDPGFVFNGPSAIGGRGGDLLGSFLGAIDEVSVYNRSLAASEIQAVYIAGSAGKCVTVPPLSCAQPPIGLVGWWSGNGNGNDIIGNNNGSFVNPSFSTGEVGQAFSFDGSGNNVRIPASATLNVGAGNGLTIEAWINPADLSQRPIVEWAVNGDYGVHLWANALNPGYLYASIFGTDGQAHVLQSAGSVLVANVFQHVAVTYDKASGSGRLFVNGVLIRETALGAFTPRTSSDLYIGYRPAGSPFGPVPFKGRIDEVSIYNRALNAGELQAIYGAGNAGKCMAAVTPFITSQPANQTIQVGGTATFTVSAGGTPSLAYQWTHNGTNIAGANATSLVLTNVSFSQAGNYAVVVTNSAGSVTSSIAALTVVFPPASVRVVGASGPAGGSVQVPVVLVANGNENALGFSLNFNPGLLTYGSISLGSGAAGATLLLNTNQIGSGKLGVAVGLPAAAVFAAGTQEVVQVSFTLAIVTNATPAALTFGDAPIIRQLSDAPGHTLTATYTDGNVVIAAVQFEGDISPRPNGDRTLTITDWVLAGRYAARLDYPTNAAEFQRADCAPGATLGDGLITVTDWVQAGRYAASLDPSTPAGGPTAETPNVIALGQGIAPTDGEDSVPARQVIVGDALMLQGQAGSVSVRLEAQGDENALGFSLSFDPAALSYTTAGPGRDAAGATLYVNAGQAAQGRLGFVLSLGSGSHFTAGSKNLLKVNFLAAATAAGNYPVSLTQIPVPRQVSDANALALSTSYINGAITVNPLPSLKIAQANQNIVLSWPLWATNFVLQQSENGLLPSATWTNLLVSASVSNNESVVTLPLDDAMKFFRLHQP